MNIFVRLKNRVRWLLMPGTDLFTHRRVRLCRHWRKGARRVLDAGCGNGWFSYLACNSGALVTAVSRDGPSIDKAKTFYNKWKKIPESRLKFLQMNLYEAAGLNGPFDEIICYETLEHIKDDAKICRIFRDLLSAGGVLHLCCPYALHPVWQKEQLDTAEAGGHVRYGYTLETYKQLLEPLGFEIDKAEGMGNPVLAWWNRWVWILQARLGDMLTMPFVLLGLPSVWFDPVQFACPYSLYVRAVKKNVLAPGETAGQTV